MISHLSNIALFCALGLGAAAAHAAVDFTAWPSSRTILLNTTATGANVPGNIAGFPVLVRLTAADFDFSQAKSDGADLRFSRTDGSALPYQIERWDKTAQAAEIWVRIDTVFGNRDGQAFRMHWGKADAVDAGNPQAVFDTASGYVSAWHLSETGNVAADGYADASGNAAHGQGANLKAANRVEGIIGWGTSFQAAAKQSITIKAAARTKFDFAGSGDMTLCHWVKVQSNPGAFYTTVAKGDRAWRMSRSGGGNVLEFAIRNVKANPALKDHEIADTKTVFAAPDWHLVIGVAKADRIAVYVDGVKEDEQAMPGSVVNSEDDVALGFNSQYQARYFDGALDEVQILRKGAGPDWARLTWENQRPGGKLVNPAGVAAIRFNRPSLSAHPAGIGSAAGFDALGRWFRPELDLQTVQVLQPLQALPPLRKEIP
jgi:hypothetical protein